MGDEKLCPTCEGERLIHDADFSEGDSDQQMYLMQDTLRPCPDCTTPTTSIEGDDMHDKQAYIQQVIDEEVSRVKHALDASYKRAEVVNQCIHCNNKHDRCQMCKELLALQEGIRDDLYIREQWLREWKDEHETKSVHTG